MVTKEHWPVCDKYPLPCPNECGEEEIERQLLQGHLEQTCPLRELVCEFRYAGCGAQLQHHLMSAHMRESVEPHLSLVAQVSKKVPELEKIVQQQADQIKQQADQIKQQADQIKQQGDQIEQQGDQIEQQGDQIEQDRDQLKQHRDLICALMKLQRGATVIVPPVDIIFDNFKNHKKECDVWFSPPFYSHLQIGGYKMCLKVVANGEASGEGTHVSVYIFLMRGEFDNVLKWPFRGKITVQLKKKDPPHHQLTIDLFSHVPRECVCKPTKERNRFGRGCGKYISHSDLYAGRYVKKNNLLFCVSDIVVYS